jgi:catechol 2,3-dioxygenase-like lactoylglutathione lyase family enzyme
VIEALAGRAPFQIAFVVPDLERAVRELDAVLGAGPWRGYVFDQTVVHDSEYHGRPHEWSARLALNSGDPQLELVQPVSGETCHADWLAAHGEGFHHLAYAVDSLDETIAQMTAAGHAVLQRGHGFGAAQDGAFAYFDTERALGFVIEAVEVPGALPEPRFRL